MLLHPHQESAPWVLPVTPAFLLEDPPSAPPSDDEGSSSGGDQAPDALEDAPHPPSGRGEDLLTNGDVEANPGPMELPRETGATGSSPELANPASPAAPCVTEDEVALLIA